MTAYRLALFTSDLGWQDTTKLAEDRRTRSLSDQLYRSLGSISANVAEGYSRGTGTDQARFYEYALGSARESRDWYFKRMVYIRARYVLRERLKVYQTDPIDAPLRAGPELANLLQSVPLADVLHPLGEPDL